MRDQAQILGQFAGRPPSSTFYPNNPHQNFPIFPLNPNQNTHMVHYSPSQSISPRQVYPEQQIQRKYSGTLGSTYDYHSQMLYPNAEPFRKDLDRKLTTIQHEELNEYYSRMIVRPSLFPQEKDQQQNNQSQDTPICFNLCCVLILVLGLVSLSVCIYLAIDKPQIVTSSSLSQSHEGHTMFLRQFNI